MGENGGATESTLTHEALVNECFWALIAALRRLPAPRPEPELYFLFLRTSLLVFAKGYDHNANYEGCEERGVRPIIPIKNMKAKTPPGPPTCEHGTWTRAEGIVGENKRLKPCAGSAIL